MKKKEEKLNEEIKNILIKKNKILNINKNKKQIKKNIFKYKNFNKIKKINWKLIFCEFIIKMIKEIIKIRWINKKNLKYKFFITILFTVIFSIFYLILDLFLYYSLNFIYII